jgi:hypothetical protein
VSDQSDILTACFSAEQLVTNNQAFALLGSSRNRSKSSRNRARSQILSGLLFQPRLMGLPTYREINSMVLDQLRSSDLKKKYWQDMRISSRNNIALACGNLKAAFRTQSTDVRRFDKPLTIYRKCGGQTPPPALPGRLWP